jgi:hypothetical protein
MNIEIFVTPLWVIPLLAVVGFVMIKTIIELIP